MPKRVGSALLLLSMLSSLSVAQTSVNSVYSRFGLGDLNRRGIGQSYALGGAGTGLYTANYLNVLNPASYAAQDTLSFIFSLGFDGQRNISRSKSNSNAFNTMNISHMVIGLPVTRWLKISSGILPFSSSGYYLKQTDRIAGSLEEIDHSFSGSGGLSQFYGAASIAPFRFLSLGVQTSYLFGSINRSVTTDFPYNDYAWRVQTETKSRVRDFTFSYGLNLHDTLPGNIFASFGVTFQPARELGARTNQITYNYLSTSADYPVPIDTIAGPFSTKGLASLPASFATGLSLKSRKLLIAADYYQQDWSQARFLGSSDSLGKMSIWSAGLQYTPNPASLKNYFAKVQYRLGGYYGNTFLVIHGEQLKDYGMTFGLGLPYKNTNSVFDISFRIGQRGTLSNMLVKENYYQLSLNMSLYDFWFIKRKFD